jgi:hypothetical protein
MLWNANSGVAPFRAAWLLIAATAACVPSAFAQFGATGAPEGAAVITQMAGRVDVLRDSTPWALNAGEWVKPGQMIVTGADGWALFKLADGSTFEVFPNSQVSFRANRGDWRDLLEVLIGNIKVHIQKLGGQPNNNKVRTPTALISVRGTIFDVKVEDNGDTTIVAVEEGLVDVDHLVLPGRVQVAAGEAVRVYKNVPLARNRIDKGSAAQAVLRELGRGLYDILARRSPGGGGPAPSGGGVPSGGGTAAGGSVGVGDQAPADPPPPSAPPPPPPPPPPAQ